MAIKGISKLETEEYISDNDSAKTKAKGATTFLLGNLDADIKAKIQDKMMLMESTQEGGTQFFMTQGTRNLEAVRFGLKGWDNFKDEDGKDIPFQTVNRYINGKNYDVVSDECLNRLPGYLVTELGQEILTKNALSQDLRKNFKMG